MTAGEEIRYEYWLKDVKELADKNNLTVLQAITVLNNINDFKDIFRYVETDKFINIYLYVKGK